MQVLPDAVIINLSPSQRKLLRDPKHAAYTKGMIVVDDSWGRPRIQVADIAGLVGRLQELKTLLVADDTHKISRPGDVIDQVILKIEDAAAAQRRTYSERPTSN